MPRPSFDLEPGTLARCLAMAAFATLPARAGTIHVPSELATLQQAIDAASAGDEVLLAAGIHRLDDTVIIEGRRGLSIRGAGSARTVLVGRGQDPASRLEVSTLEVIRSSDIVISDLEIRSDVVLGDTSAGALRIDHCADVEAHHLLLRRHASNGIVVLASTVDVHDNVFTELGDDAVSFRHPTGSADPTPSGGIVRNNTIAFNRGGQSIGIYASGPLGELVIFDNIVHGNDFGLLVEDADVRRVRHGHDVVSANGFDWYGLVAPSPTDLDCAPAFADPPADLHLLADSCATDAGVASFAGRAASPLDLDSAIRPVGMAVDIGADETCGEPFPAGVGATLRGAHAGDAVTMSWHDARSLSGGEHFHLLKTTLHPAHPWWRASAEPLHARSHDETDTSAWLQFFDLRVANACEEQSLDEFPPSHP